MISTTRTTRCHRPRPRGEGTRQQPPLSNQWTRQVVASTVTPAATVTLHGTCTNAPFKAVHISAAGPSRAGAGGPPSRAGRPRKERLRNSPWAFTMRPSTAVMADHDGCLRPDGAHQSLELARQLVDCDVTTRRAWGVAAQFELFDAAVTPNLFGLPWQLRSREPLPGGQARLAEPARAWQGQATAPALKLEVKEVGGGRSHCNLQSLCGLKSWALGRELSEEARPPRRRSFG